MSQGTERETTMAARKRAAVEMIARHEAALRRTAQRYSLDAQDAEDAYQRALEIALTKAPTTELGELIRWTQTVTKNEALAVRQGREKLLGRYPRREGVEHDPIATAPARGDGPAERVELREDIARSREALRALKPAELQALGLLAEGYSYAEIGERTGFSQTKVNRVLAEGRARFRGLLARHEDGSRCRELRPLLSAFCDGEASAREADAVREHLRACAGCRATLRAYRRAPRLAAVLLPPALPSRSLLGRLHDYAANLASRLPGMGGGSSATQVAAGGGGRGVGMAALAKLAGVCLGAAGGAAACVAAGVLPAPALISEQPQKPTIERRAAAAQLGDEEARSTDEPTEEPSTETKRPEPHRRQSEQHGSPPEEAEAATDEATAESAGTVEYEAPPAAPEPAPTPTESASTADSGSAAGEFGP